MELGLYKRSKMPLYCDNSGAILLTKNLVFHEWIKYIKIKYYYIKQLINKNIIDFIFVPIKEQKANGLTKPLANGPHQVFIKYLGFN
jgi:hypothetical protein